MHYQGETATSLIGYALLIGIILWAIKHFKKTNDGYISLSEALKTGVGTALISALIISIYTVIVIQYLDPEFIDKSIEYQKQKLIQEDPEIPLDDVNKMFEMQKEFSGPFIISGFIIILNLFIGFLISLIVGLIVKKSKPE
jgi:small-conductance mechanosensitive channel